MITMPMISNIKIQSNMGEHEGDDCDNDEGKENQVIVDLATEEHDRLIVEEIENLILGKESGCNNGDEKLFDGWRDNGWREECGTLGLGQRVGGGLFRIILY